MVAETPRTAERVSIIPADVERRRFQAATRGLITPAALRRLVAIRVERPARPLGPDLECMAKVVYHEAANQALPGQLAVAQVIINRTRGGGIFPKSVCAVVNQTGQFFLTRHYRVPPADRARWRTAVAIADLARRERLAQVAPGALFYHAAFAHPAWSRRHERIAQVGDQVFYR
jgi:spore germination cell wall hydrolase CwlJ-like protein